MKTYFQYPWRDGPVYMVHLPPSAFRMPRTVVLPNAKGTMVSLLVARDAYPKATLTTLAPGKNALVRAGLVIKKDGFRQTLRKRRDWNRIVPMIIAAACVNTLFSVQLTEKEYNRLQNGGLQRMLYRFPKSVRPLLSLRKDYLGPGTHSLELFRYCGGGCR